MPMAGTTPNRWVVRSLVVLTALLCLGVVGYFGQVWWASHLASKRYPIFHFEIVTAGITTGGETVLGLGFSDPKPDAILASHLRMWRRTPWYGSYEPLGTGICWIPPGYYLDMLKRVTGQDLPNNPDVWEAWFNTHPNLVWDEKLKRLVDKP